MSKERIEEYKLLTYAELKSELQVAQERIKVLEEALKEIVKVGVHGAMHIGDTEYMSQEATIAKSTLKRKE